MSPRVAALAVGLLAVVALAAPMSASAKLPASLWAVEFNSATAKTATPARLAKLRRNGINAVVVNPLRVRGKALVRLRRRAAAARLLMIAPRVAKQKGLGKKAASKMTARIGGVTVTVVRVSSPTAVAAYKNARTGRVLTLVRLAPFAKSAAQPWRLAIGAARGSAALDLGVTPTGTRHVSALDSFMSLLAEPIDLAAPTAPGGLTQTAATESGAGISWLPSTDDVGVAGYDVYTGTTLLGSTTATNYSLSSLACGVNYPVFVVAKDASGKRSNPAAVTVRTAACSLALPISSRRRRRRTSARRQPASPRSRLPGTPLSTRQASRATRSTGTTHTSAARRGRRTPTTASPAGRPTCSRSRRTTRSGTPRYEGR